MDTERMQCKVVELPDVHSFEAGASARVKVFFFGRKTAASAIGMHLNTATKRPPEFSWVGWPLF